MCPCHSTFCTRIKRRLYCIQNFNFVFSLFPFFPPLPLSLLFFPQGLSHLMMSEQGRCFLLVGLQLPELLAFVPLAGCSEPHRRWQAICCLSFLLWQRGHPVVGGTFPCASWFPTPINPSASPFCTAICHRAWPRRAASEREA